MRRFTVVVFVFIVFVIGFSARAHSAEPIKTNSVAGFVDFRQLLLKHPIFREFDIKTRRFNNTASAWVGDLEEARKNYDAELEKLSEEQKMLTKQYSLISASPQNGQNSVTARSIWEKLAVVNARRASLEKAKQATELRGNYLHGAGTGLESLVPIINAMSGDILAVARSLSAKYDNIPILDLSCFQSPVPEPTPNRSILFQNTHATIWQANPDPKAIALWLAEFGRHLRNEYPQRFSHPFRYGVIDLRQEAVSAMRFSTP
ncbi:MAG: hypothetical protein KKB51_03025 [Candidatus Riflebacteria bacterium]|nr:hypothetical protein [Candidatus Riflebacteria bacterium]